MPFPIHQPAAEREDRAPTVEIAVEPKRDVRQRTLDEACDEDRWQRRYELLVRARRLRRGSKALGWAASLLAGMSCSVLLWLNFHQFEPEMLQTWAPLVVSGWVLAIGMSFASEPLIAAAGRMLGITADHRQAREIDRALEVLKMNDR